MKILIFVFSFLLLSTGGYATLQEQQQDNPRCHMLKQKYEQQQKSEEKTSSWSNSQVVSLPDTASEAHLKRIMGGNTVLDSNLSTILKSKQALKIQFDTHDILTRIKKVLEAEKENKGAYVFYHGCPSEVGFIADIYTIIRNFLFLTNHQDSRTLRGMAEKFIHSTDFEGLIEEISSVSASSSASIKIGTCLLSANIALFGSHEDYMSDTFAYWMKGSSCNSQDVGRTSHYF